MLSAANEAVLMAVEGMTFDRQMPTPAMIGLKAQPPLATHEVMLIAASLAREGYLVVGDEEGLTYYTLTARGSDYCASVAARGT